MTRNGWIVCAWIVAVAAAGPARAQQTVDMLDGRSLSGKVEALTAESLKIKLDDEPQTLPRKDVSEIVFGSAQDVLAKAGQTVLQTVDGGYVGCSELSLAEGVLQLHCPLVGQQRAKLKSARAILMPASNQTPQAILQECQRQRIEPGSRDVLAIERADGKWVAVAGVLLSIDEEKVGIRYEGQDRTINRKGVRAIFLAELAGERPRPAGVLQGRSGALLYITGASIEGSSLQAETLAFGAVEVSTEALASLRFFSDRLVRLTDLEPSEVNEYGLFDHTFPYRVGGAVGGGPLRLRGKVHRHGLGLHSFSELSYAINGEYETFAALVGIDDAVRPAGLATLKILGDGEPLAIEIGDRVAKELQISGEAPAVSIRVDVSGIKTLTLRVEFGADGLDVSDHVDIVSPRLVK